LNVAFANSLQKSVTDSSTENVLVEDLEFSLPSVPKEDPSMDDIGDKSRIKITSGVIPFEIDDLDDSDDEDTIEEKAISETPTTSEEEEDWFNDSTAIHGGLPAYEMLRSNTSSSSRGSSLASSVASIVYPQEKVTAVVVKREEFKIEEVEVKEEIPVTREEKSQGDSLLFDVVKGAGMIIALEAEGVTMAANEQVQVVEKTLGELDDSMGFSKTIDGVNDQLKITETLDALSRTINEKTRYIYREIGTKIAEGIDTLREGFSELLETIQTTEPSQASRPTTDS